MNWTKLTDNPVDPVSRGVILEHLIGLRKFKCMSAKEWLIKTVKGKIVLDIGVAEHDLLHMDKDSWKHRYIKANAEYCLGLDIIEDLVVELNKRGYDVINMDATSDEYIGQKFDIINIGDVIEHVNDPVKLLNFAKRHLSDHGKIIVNTPNVYYYGWIFDCIRNGTMLANFEHTFWITPSMALEISRRSGLKYVESVFLCLIIKLKRT
jgi:SAM-dependent methyltransferase